MENQDQQQFKQLFDFNRIITPQDSGRKFSESCILKVEEPVAMIDQNRRNFFDALKYRLCLEYSLFQSTENIETPFLQTWAFSEKSQVFKKQDIKERFLQTFESQAGDITSLNFFETVDFIKRSRPKSIKMQHTDGPILQPFQPYEAERKPLKTNYFSMIKQANTTFKSKKILVMLISNTEILSIKLINKENKRFATSIDDQDKSICENYHISNKIFEVNYKDAHKYQALITFGLQEEKVQQRRKLQLSACYAEDILEYINLAEQQEEAIFDIAIMKALNYLNGLNAYAKPPVVINWLYLFSQRYIMVDNQVMDTFICDQLEEINNWKGIKYFLYLFFAVYEQKAKQKAADLKFIAIAKEKQLKQSSIELGQIDFAKYQYLNKVEEFYLAFVLQYYRLQKYKNVGKAIRVYLSICSQDNLIEYLQDKIEEQIQAIAASQDIIHKRFEQQKDLNARVYISTSTIIIKYIVKEKRLSTTYISKYLNWMLDLFRSRPQPIDLPYSYSSAIQQLILKEGQQRYTFQMQSFKDYYLIVKKIYRYNSDFAKIVFQNFHQEKPFNRLAIYVKENFSNNISMFLTHPSCQFDYTFLEQFAERCMQGLKIAQLEYLVQQLDNQQFHQENFQKLFNSAIDKNTRLLPELLSKLDNQIYTLKAIKMTQYNFHRCKYAKMFKNIVQEQISSKQDIQDLLELRPYFTLLYSLQQRELSKLVEEAIFRLLKKLKISFEVFTDKIDKLYIKQDSQTNKIKQGLLNLAIQKLADEKDVERTLKSWLSSSSKKICSFVSGAVKKGISMVKSIFKNIDENKVAIVQIKQMHQQHRKNKQYYQNIIKQARSIEEAYRRYEEKWKNLQIIAKMLEPYKEVFAKELHFVRGKLQLEEQAQLSQLLENNQPITMLEKHCKKIIALQNHPFWDKSKITSIPFLIYQMEEISKQINSQLQSKQLTLIQFRQIVEHPASPQIVDFICEPINRERIRNIMNKLKQQNLKKLNNCLEGMKYITQKLNCKDVELEFDNFKMIYQKVMNKEEGLLMIDVSTQIQVIEQKLRKIFNWPSKKDLRDFYKDDIYRTILFTYEAQTMFEVLQEKSVNLNSMNDLREYINDIQNCQLKFENIKEFEIVLRYIEIIRKSKTFKKYIKDVENLMKKDEGKSLPQHIESCSSIYKSILQKIDEASNRETSFKYEIQSIFKHSQFSINQQLQLEIRFVLEEDKKIKGMKKGMKIAQRKEQQIKRLEFKQLNNFMDKSILLINDIGRENNNDANMSNLMKLFQDYCEFFKVIQDIKIRSEHLLHYGYDPRQIKRVFTIKDKDYHQIAAFRDSLVGCAQHWVNQIKSIYEESFLLTHFIGDQLNQFVNSCLNKQYQPSLLRIVNLSEEEFNSVMMDLDAARIKYSTESFEAIRAIVDIFKPCEQDYLKLNQVLRNKQTDMLDERMDRIIQQCQNKVKLITCEESEYQYCFFDPAFQDMLRPNEVFYCQNQNFFQEIQFFIYRSILNFNKPHYLVGMSRLKEEVKLLICDLLNNLFCNNYKSASQANLNFIDNAPIDKVYTFISQSKYIISEKKKISQDVIEERTKSIIKSLANTIVIQSKIAGLGKTFRIERIAKEKEENLIYFSLAGNIKLSSIAKRLKKIKFQPNSALLIQIGHIEKQQELLIFLSQIILFRCIYYRQYIFLPEKASIYIEMENIFTQKPKQRYHILNLLKNSPQNYIYLDSFSVKDIHFSAQDENDKFALIYLGLLERQNQINTREFSYTKHYFQNMSKMAYPKASQELIQKYFVSRFQPNQGEPTFILYKTFLKLLFKVFRTFSDSSFFRLEHIQENHQAFPQLRLNECRQKFLKVCIDNTLQFLKETSKTNDFNKGTAYKHSFSEKIKQFPMLILPSFNYQQFSFVYQTDKSVDLSIKSLLLSQNPKQHSSITRIRDIGEVNTLFQKTSINKLSQKQELQFILNTLYQLSGNKKFLSCKGNSQLIPELKTYKITLDNFFKMCLIIYRAKSNVPCIIMGESGVGKTALIRFLVEVVQTEKLFVYNIHAGITEVQISQWVDQFTKAAEDNATRMKKIWVFFDQFNTTDQLSYIKEIVVDRRFQGSPLPQNITFLAACNPYRAKAINQGRVNAGIKKVESETVNNSLAFKVLPPNYSMISLMWDYQQLGHQQLTKYIQKMVDGVNYKDKKNLITLLVQTHEIFKKQIELSSVSLRDIYRFTKLFHWFLENKPNKIDLTVSDQFDNTQRAVILSYIFCYAQRYSTFGERKGLLEKAERILLGSDKGYMRKVLEHEQTNYVNQFKQHQEKIAFNSALMDNLFTSFVCLMNKIPILIIGNPGSSKSLCIKMLCSNLRGENSTNDFCRKYPSVNMIYFQGSQSCTSQGVEQVFEKAIKIKKDYGTAGWRAETCILFDEIGLAEKSVHNPLKVLHSKLEAKQQHQEVCFIGISNWELDCAKMSRFMIVAHSNPSQEDVKTTAVKIGESYFQHNHFEDELQKLGFKYFRFIEEWNKNQRNRQGFFGLRDFYNYIKHICKHLTEGRDIQQLIEQSIQINFDGQKNSLNLFLSIAGQQSTIKHMDPITMVKKNLEDADSRCLLLIIKGDALIPIINKGIEVDGKNRQVVCIYGSTFKQDQQSEDYNLKTTSRVIAHISRGDILTFKDINNSIQTSLYDLFNKSFTRIMNKKYCRIAVGANSNPKCFVHNNFNAIVYVDEEKLKDLDLPFLNRFEKHYLNLSCMIQREEIEILTEVQEWIDKLLSFQRKYILKRENYIINCSEESMVTLIIKTRGKSNRSFLIKKTLLQNMTTDLGIALRSHPNIEEDLSIRSYLEEIVPPHQCQEDMIVFTYDLLSSLLDRPTVYGRNIEIIRLGEIHNEKMLEDRLTSAFNSYQSEKIEVKLNYQLHYMHINYLLFKCKQLKGKSSKQVIITIQLHRYHFNRFRAEHVNISYLHQYQQYFLESLDEYSNLHEVLSADNLLQLYRILQCSKHFSSNLMNTIKSIRFQAGQANGQAKETIQIYFDLSVALCCNPKFNELCASLLQQYLGSLSLNLQELLANKSDIMHCSNIEQAIASNINQKITNFTYHLLKIIMEKGLALYFLPPTNSYGEVFAVIGSLCEQGKQCLTDIYRQELDDEVSKFMDRVVQIIEAKTFNKMVGANIIQVKSNPTILPGSGPALKAIFYEEQTKESQIIENTGRKRQIDVQMVKQQCKNNKFKLIQRHQSTPGFQRLLMNDVLSVLSNGNLITLKRIAVIDLVGTCLDNFSLEEKIVIAGQRFTIGSAQNNDFILLSAVELLSLVLQIFSPVQLSEFMKIIPYDEDYNVVAVSLLQTVLDCCCSVLQLQERNIVKVGGPVEYLAFFKEVSLKIREILSNYSQSHNLQTPGDFYIIFSFLQLIQELSRNSEQFILLFLSQEVEGSIYKKIFTLLNSCLNDSDGQDTEVIINQLSLNLFGDWLESVKAETSMFHDELTECIKSFVALANQYVLFANNSTYFITSLLEGYCDHDDFASFQAFIAEEGRSGLIKRKLLMPESNFTVAVSNFIAKEIKSICQSFQSQQKDQIIAETYLDHFKAIASREQVGLYHLLQIQFMKYYLGCYTHLLLNNINNQLQLQADNVLCQRGELMKHMRVYIFKIVYAHYKQDMKAIQKDFFSIKKCKWIKHIQQFTTQNYYEEYLPPKILEPNDPFIKLLEKFRQNFANDQILKQVIEEGLTRPSNLYELLGFFMQNFYFSNKEDRNKGRIQAFLQKIKIDKNEAPVNLLTHYLQAKAYLSFDFNPKQQRSKILPFLNYLNVLVAHYSTSCCFLEMFFTDGQWEKKLSDKLQNLYLIGSMSNPALQRVNFILERHKQKMSGSSYVICSTQCDFIAPIGGNFYGVKDGCQHPTSFTTCPFCGTTIGARQYGVLLNTSGRVIKANQVENEISRIQAKNKVTLTYGNSKQAYQLTGYTLGRNTTDLQESIQRKRNFQNAANDFLLRQNKLIYHCILQGIINIVWGYMNRSESIKSKEFQKLFKLKTNQITPFLSEAAKYYFIIANQMLDFANEKETTLWHLGISKVLFKFIEDYSQSHNLTLSSARARESFQTGFDDKIFRFYEVDKQKLINQSLNVIKISKMNIITQTGNVQNYLKEYPLIRLFKLQNHALAPSLDNIKQYYQETLAKHYPLLEFLINSQEIQKKLQNYRVILHFITAIRKRFNFKMSREEAKKEVQALWANDSTLAKQANLQEFIDAWNTQSANLKSVRQQCAQISFIEPITEKYPLNNFFLDSIHKDNRQSKLLLGFITSIANTYNQTCIKVNNLIMISYPNYNFPSIKETINPTNLTTDDKLLEFPIPKIEQFIEQYASFTVEYGISQPNYPFNQIQSKVMKKLHGFRFMLTNSQQYNFMNYEGEQITFVHELKEDERQSGLEQGTSKKVGEYIKSFRTNDAEIFNKILKRILGSLELAMVYLKKSKDQKLYQISIDSFIEKEQIGSMCREVTEEPIKSILLCNLVDLYETIEDTSYDKIELLLDAVYKAPLQEAQKKEIIQLVTKMKKHERKPSIPSFEQFRKAVYRLIGRSLVFMQGSENSSIADHLCTVYALWPKSVNFAELSSESGELWQVLSKVRVGQIVDLLQFVPFKQQVETDFKMKQPERLSIQPIKVEHQRNNKMKSKW